MNDVVLWPIVWPALLYGAAGGGAMALMLHNGRSSEAFWLVGGVMFLIMFAIGAARQQQKRHERELQEERRRHDREMRDLLKKLPSS